MLRLSALLDALALFERCGDEAHQAEALWRIARLSLQQGAPRQAFRACRLGLQACADPAQQAELYGSAAEALARRDHLRLASALFERAQRLFEQAGRGPRARAAALARGVLLAHLGADGGEAARAHLLQLLESCSQAGDAEGFAEALLVLGELDLRAGRPEDAELCAATAAAALEQARLPKSSAAALLLGRARAQRGLLDPARRALEEAVQLLTERAPLRTLSLAQAHLELGWVLMDLGQPQDARAALLQALRGYEQAGEGLQAAHVELVLASWHGAEERAEALRHIVCALDWLARAEAPPPDLLTTARDLLHSLPPGRLLHHLLGRVDALAQRARATAGSPGAR